MPPCTKSDRDIDLESKSICERIFIASDFIKSGKNFAKSVALLASKFCPNLLASAAAASTKPLSFVKNPYKRFIAST